MSKTINEIVKIIKDHMPEDDSLNSMWMDGVKYGMELSIRYIRQHYSDETDGVSIDTICSFLAEWFEAPCNFSSIEEDWVEIVDPSGVWCDKNCDDNYAKCWKRLFEQMELRKNDKR